MDTVLSWIGGNKEWLFSGIGVAAISVVCWLVRCVYRRWRIGHPLRVADWSAAQDMGLVASPDFGKCRLCLEEKSLCYSHVIPEFLYLPMYDEKHRLLNLSADTSHALSWSQKGWRDHLLCSSCENQFSKHENYARSLLFGGELPVTVVENSDIHEVCEHVDYRAFKLFQMSILWRAGITSLRFFTQVNLNSHAATLRSMLLANDPGPSHQYGCVMMTLLHERDLCDLIRAPDRVKIGGQHCFRFIMGGFLWLFFLSRPPSHDLMSQLFIQENGRMCFLKDDIRNLEFFGFDRHLLGARRRDIEDLAGKHKKRP